MGERARGHIVVRSEGPENTGARRLYKRETVCQWFSGPSLLTRAPSVLQERLPGRAFRHPDERECIIWGENRGSWS